MPSSPAVVLVTGASRGIGRGIALRVTQLGHSAIINYVGNKKAAEETVRLCQKNRVSNQQQFIPLQADVALKKDRARLIENTLKTLGSIDALVNNAGIAPRVRTDITETSEDSFDEVMKVNLRGPFFLTQLVAQHWLSKRPRARLAGGFKIIFVSSISAISASVNRAEYCVSKAGLGMVTQLWATRLAAEGIQVFELRPGIMETDMTASVKEQYDKRLAQGLVPQRRWGKPDDVGRAVGAILSDHFPFSTGEVIYLDGGLHLHPL